VERPADCLSIFYSKPSEYGDDVRSEICEVVTTPREDGDQLRLPLEKQTCVREGLLLLSLYIYIYIYMDKCVYVYVCVYVCVCVYIYVCV